MRNLDELEKKLAKEVGEVRISPAVEAALLTFPFERLLEFVQWPLWVVEPNRVGLVDLRFGTPRDSFFSATADFDDRGRLIDSQFGKR